MPYSTRDYLLYWVARRQLSRQELINKALKKEYPKTEINDSIKFLESNGFISDIRLAENLIHFYYQQRGLSWIRQKARQRLIPAEVFEKAWIDYTDRIRENMDRNVNSDHQPFFPEVKQKVLGKYKLNRIIEADDKTKQKIASFLAYRGFQPFEMINKWIEEERNI
ncbi:MAG: hypothetical protein OHK0017_09060 [Patescibacteria group bacterium]